jgi:hypothetical protein
MREGYKTTWELLEKDYGLEGWLIEEFENMAKEMDEPELKKLLGDIALRGEKNRDKIVRLLNDLGSPDYQVKLKCPVCGWGVTFGDNLTIGTERKCQACGVWLSLGEKGGDYYLQNLGRKDQGF